ncbi:MAG: Uma2 family endonuclease [Proteobacteria bacterium]|nr:Uma2 family endonuclease [Burkholderiales bacterium]
MSATLPRSRRPITVDEYHLMAEAGVFGPEERVELIEGELITMPPIGWPHAHAVNVLTRRLVLAFGEDAIVSVQNPVVLRPLSEPQPDFAILRRDSWRRQETPDPADVLLLIEVADSSLAFDRRVKLPLYARHDVPAMWLVDIGHQLVRCHDLLDGGAYTRVVDKRPGDYLELEGFASLRLAVAEIFALPE